MKENSKENKIPENWKAKQRKTWEYYYEEKGCCLRLTQRIQRENNKTAQVKK